MQARPAQAASWSWGAYLLCLPSAAQVVLVVDPKGMDTREFKDLSQRRRGSRLMRFIEDPRDKGASTR